MPSDTPGGNLPGSGPNPDGQGDPPSEGVGGWPADLVPPPAPEPQAPTAWSSAPDPGSAAGPTPAPGPGPIRPPQWDPPAAPPPAAPPPAAAGWGAPSAPGQSAGPPSAAPGGQWAAPPAQPGGWGPAPDTQGAPPAGAWNPQPASSGNGCLKACLIVGAIIVVLGIIGIVAVAALGVRFAQDIGFNPDGSTKPCELITDEELSSALDGRAEALPLGGLADSTVGVVLDRRALPDAPACWIVGDTSTSVTGRLARQDGGDASGDFQRARQDAETGGYYAGEAGGLGDEAFCTGMSDSGSFGILVRSGGSLAYVGLLDPAAMEGNALQADENGVIVSPETCAIAGAVAAAMLR
jgi:hypothetical protein